MQLRSQSLNMTPFNRGLQWLTPGNMRHLRGILLSVLAVLFHANHALLSSAKPVPGGVSIPFLALKVQRKRATHPSPAYQRADRGPDFPSCMPCNLLHDFIACGSLDLGLKMLLHQA
jgi:hypothetical protein